MSQSHLTIAIPTYNRCETLLHNVRKILQCNISAFEIVVSDNNSNDGTNEELNKISDPRLTYYRNDANLGLEGNCRLIFNRSKSDFVLVLSDEDYVTWKNIESVIKQLGKSDVSLYIGSILNEAGNYYYKKNPGIYTSKNEYVQELILSHPYMSGVVYERNKAIKALKYLGRMAQYKDIYSVYPLWLLFDYFCINYSVKVIDGVLAIQGPQAKSFIRKPKGKLFNHIENRYSQYLAHKMFLQGEVEDACLRKKLLTKRRGMFFKQLASNGVNRDTCYVLCKSVLHGEFPTLLRLFLWLMKAVVYPIRALKEGTTKE